MIASGYLFTALIIVPYLLAFPGRAWRRMGLIGGLQTAAWLYVLWHCGFPLFVIAYALSKDEDPEQTALAGQACVPRSSGASPGPQRWRRQRHLCASMGEALLPRIMLDPTRFSPTGPISSARRSPCCASPPSSCSGFADARFSISG